MAGIGKYNISSYIDELVPDHVESSFPELVNFLKTYALYLERENKSGFYLNSLDIQRDIDFVEESLLTELQNEIGIAVPRDFATDPRMFYKRLVEFYRSRGTPESITSFFRMIYDDDVETYFPFVDILNPSDGDWTNQETAIKADKSTFTPNHVFTISGTPSVTPANNDAAQAAIFDDDVVFVNDTLQTPVTDYSEEVYSDSGVTKYRLNFTSALTNGDVVRTYAKGLFTTVNGFLSDKKFLQDSFYYQQFSYVLKTGKNVADWSNAFTRLVHPAGFKFFGEILINILALNQGNTEVQIGNQVPVGKIQLTLGAHQIGPISFNSHILEKSYTHFARGSSELSIVGMQNHWDNIKFRYLGPNSDLAHWTVQDSINNNISTQFGVSGGFVTLGNNRSSLHQYTP
jgi:hypothetical protein